ncbi:Flp pilus assembly protein CpaB [Sphingomonas rubra]|uniref:Pilus assembly protein CpaB n=1 Tax=Sphingomonas rubra TaxID=634430 RepID=A0A1I5UEZ6_9SPHN|nr:Flp pilus assembly protein CpaB [Sphingomonas rubra]SFP93607.1 pilus assembly protein CpaB [Sphingomonas rubra]
MDSRKLILLVGALVVAAVTAFFARTLVAGSAAPEAMAVAAAQPVIDGPEVLVATRPLPVGTILDASALRFQPWPKELVDGAYYLKQSTDLQALQGTVVRNAITAGQPVTQGALVRPGDRGFLAAALGPGMRAVTVPVTAQAAVGGFVFPGDRIDLVLTQSIEGGEGPPLRTSETFLRNVRVLATDQRTNTMDGEDGKSEVKTFSTVTLEATPKMAEQIAVAQTVGTLSLSLRSIADNAGDLEEAIASGAIKVPGDAKGEREMLLQVAGRPVAGAPTFVTGADVSRFQRRTVPVTRTAAPASSIGSPMGPTTGAPAAAPLGPVVRVARGNNVTAVPVGGK